MIKAKFRIVYARALKEGIKEKGEAALRNAYESGRYAIQNGLGIMDVISTHNQELLALLSRRSNAEECVRIARTGQELLTECLAPFELTHRGFKDIETVNRELESFTYSVSHDLRAPLRAIEGFSKMLAQDLENGLDAEAKRKAGVIQDGARKMDRLIEGLLDFSRVGRSAMSPVKLDLKPIVNEIWKEQRRVHPGRNMELQVGLLPKVYADRALIRQVLLNLLANAVKFTKTRECALIEVKGAKDESECFFSVKDNGAGFDMTYRNKLFGVFQRLHSGSEYEGTGVGLAIVQRIIQRHRGRVWAEGKAGEGAIFTFTLPAAEG